MQLPYASDYVIVNRDPGFLTLAAMWMGDHRTVTIPVDSVQAVAQAVPGVKIDSGAFNLVGDQLQIQGAKALPAVLALGTWVIGDRAALVGNLALGALALLAVYAFGRRLLGPWWALLPMVAIGACVPMAVFTRAAYTEPLNMALLFTALVFLWSAFETSKRSQYVVCGLAVGAGALVRIDGGVVIAGLVAGLALAMFVRSQQAPRSQTVRDALDWGSLTVSAIIPLVMGYLDLRWHSQVYLANLGTQFRSVALAVLLAVVGGALVILMSRTRAVDWFVDHRAMLGNVAFVATLVTGAILASRPLWMTAHHFPADSGYAGNIAALQASEGLPVDGTQSYDEMTLTWLSWYFGWAAVVAGFIGLAMLVRQALSTRSAQLIAFLVTVGAPSLLYLVYVSITPEQVWAMRRLLSVTIPALLLCAAWAIKALAQARGPLPPTAHKTAAGVVAGIVFAYPVTTWGQLFASPEQGGRYPELRAVCNALPSNKVIYAKSTTEPYLESLLVACNADVVEVPRLDSPALTRQIVAAWGGEPVSVVAFDPGAVAWDRAAVPKMTSDISRWVRTIGVRPSVASLSPSAVFVGVTNPDGTVQPR